MRFGFLINEVLTGLRRNVTMTVAMILTTAISIGLFGGGLLVVRLADSSRNIYLDRVESQVFLTNDVSANDPTCDADPCKALRKQIEDRDDVKSVRFLNRDDAYDDAIKKFPQYKDVAGKDAFPASFIVKLDDPEQHKEFDDAMVEPARRAQRAEPEGPDRPAVRGARRAEQRGVRRRPGAGGRRDPVDSQHGSSRRVHAANGGRHHATGRRQSLVHPVAVPRRGDARRVHRRRDRHPRADHWCGRCSWRRRSTSSIKPT